MESKTKETSMPITPEMLKNDDWMDDASARAEFQKGLTELDKKLKPMTDALDASERLTEDDWAICINARD
jgi:hypothetical protein